MLVIALLPSLCQHNNTLYDMAIVCNGNCLLISHLANVLYASACQLAMPMCCFTTPHLCCLQAVQTNGSMYLHVYFARAGIDMDAPEEDLPPHAIFSKSHSELTWVQLLIPNCCMHSVVPSSYAYSC